MKILIPKKLIGKFIWFHFAYFNNCELSEACQLFSLCMKEEKPVSEKNVIHIYYIKTEVVIM